MAKHAVFLVNSAEVTVMFLTTRPQPLQLLLPRDWAFVLRLSRSIGSLLRFQFALEERFNQCSNRFLSAWPGFLEAYLDKEQGLNLVLQSCFDYSSTEAGTKRVERQNVSRGLTRAINRV